MKAILNFVVLALGLAIAASPVRADETATTGPQRFGTAVTEKKPVNIAQLAKNPKRFVGKTVRLEGTVKAVCQGKGCWAEVASAKGASFMAKSLDDAVLLPKDCAGQRIVVQGVVTELAAPGAEAHKDHDCKTEGHACPTPSYLVSTQGIELFPTKN